MNEIIQRRSLKPATSVGEDPLAELTRIVHGSQPVRPSGAPVSRVEASHVEPTWDEPSYDQGEDDGVAEEEWYDEDQAAYAEADDVYDDRGLHETAPLYAEERPVQPERRRGNGGMLAAAAIIALAVMGGGGALAYKSGLMSSVAMPGGAVPLIQASAEPVKVTPPAQAAVQDDGSAAAKEIFDRAGNAASAAATKMVSRDEQPMPLPDTKPLPATSGRIGAVSTADADGAEAIDLTGPRKVKTIKILADGRAAADMPVRRVAARAVSPEPTLPETTGTTTQMASLDLDNAVPAQPTADVTPSAEAAPADTAPAAEAPVVRPPARPKIAKAKPAAEQLTQVASLDPTPPIAAGGFVVQVASQKSEADAAGTFKRLQSKYSGVLGGMTPSIVKADLGDKGVFYRIRVGPMATREAAVGLCTKLQAAGGSCVVARN